MTVFVQHQDYHCPAFQDFFALLTVPGHIFFLKLVSHTECILYKRISLVFLFSEQHFILGLVPLQFCWKNGQLVTLLVRGGEETKLSEQPA